MLADLDETIRQLLVAELPIKNGEIDVRFHQPKREWSSRLTKPTVNFFLYDLKENVALRRHQWEKMPMNGNRQLVDLKRTPFRVDCYYMMSAWATEPEDEHLLLSNSMVALFRYPVLPRERLVGVLQSQPYELQVRLASHDKLTNPAEVWSALDNEMRPTVCYIVTVAMDPWAKRTEVIPRVVTIRTGIAEKPRQERLDVLSSSVNFITGYVRDKAEEPVAGLRISLRGEGYTAVTQTDGEFRLGPLPDGEYTLLTWLDDQPPIEHAIEVPNTTGYELKI